MFACSPSLRRHGVCLDIRVTSPFAVQLKLVLKHLVLMKLTSNCTSYLNWTEIDSLQAAVDYMKRPF